MAKIIKKTSIKKESSKKVATKVKKVTTKSPKVKTSGKVGRPTKHEERYKNVGRKTLMTPETLGKLETAFASGYTDEQACVFADISPNVLYDYCKKKPEFHEKKELLKKRVDIQAKSNLFKLIEIGDKTTSMWWLERKCKEEFSTRNEVTGKDGGAIQNVNFTSKELKKWYDDLRCNDDS